MIKFLFVLAILGIFNCTLLEPVLAASETHHADCTAEEEGHCDFICCAMHHTWDISDSSVMPDQPNSISNFISPVFQHEPEPPFKFIFHPPLVLA